MRTPICAGDKQIPCLHLVCLEVSLLTCQRLDALDTIVHVVKRFATCPSLRHGENDVGRWRSGGQRAALPEQVQPVFGKGEEHSQ